MFEPTSPPWTARLGEIFSGSIPVASVAERKLPDGFMAFSPADSYLIAAAPDLLAALKKLVSDANHITRPDQWHQLNDATIQACAAIAKARGET